MKHNEVEVYRTGQGVPMNGEYTCHSGHKLKLHSNEEFPVCPISGKGATWKRDDA
ncbi:hypothetical protein ACFSCX_12335 [Bacillus salitolerans]|uniref:YjzC family protein n=1 Tax=Bacillus salitolerans TaxID=1437434 RepID=A0ABW4LQK9_9BACI